MINRNHVFPLKYFHIIITTIIGSLVSIAGCGNDRKPSAPHDTTISIPGFVGGETLKFDYPSAWEVGQEEGLVTIAPFGAPHRGMAGTLPKGMVITILPYRTTLYDPNTAMVTTLSNGSWIVGDRPGFAKQVVFYVGDKLAVSVIGSYSDETQLEASDIESIESVCASITLDNEVMP